MLFLIFIPCLILFLPLTINFEFFCFRVNVFMRALIISGIAIYLILSFLETFISLIMRRYKNICLETRNDRYSLLFVFSIASRWLNAADSLEKIVFLSVGSIIYFRKMFFFVWIKKILGAFLIKHSVMAKLSFFLFWARIKKRHTVQMNYYFLFFLCELIKQKFSLIFFTKFKIKCHVVKS